MPIFILYDDDCFIYRFVFLFIGVYCKGDYFSFVFSVITQYIVLFLYLITIQNIMLLIFF